MHAIISPSPPVRRPVSLQFTNYSSTPILLILQPSSIAARASTSNADVTVQTLPFKAFEPTIEIRERKSRSVFVEASYTVETGEAERIAVDWTAKGGEGGTTREYTPPCSVSVSLTTSPLVESHLQSQRAAVKMLHDRILVLVQYVTEVAAGANDRPRNLGE